MNPLDIKTVVCAADFSEGSEAALIRAADLAERLRARLHILHSDPLFSAGRSGVPREDAPPDAHTQRLEVFATRVLGGRDALNVVGPELVVRHGEYAADSILRYAEVVSADLLVLGTHGRRGVQHLLLGSVAEHVVQRAACPVLVVPNAAARTAPSPTAPILVPVDFSTHTEATLDFAGRLAPLFSAPIALAHVVEDSDVLPLLDAATGEVIDQNAPVLVAVPTERLQALAGTVGSTPAVTSHVRVGSAHREIAELAEELGAGLIVMATHGRTGVQHALLGSVTEQTLRRAPCPVLAVRVSGGGNG